VIPLVVLLYANIRRHQPAALLGLAALAVLGGGGLFALTEHVSFTTGVYWAVVTASTVGYGDVTPHNTAGRVVAVIVILTVIPLLAGSSPLPPGSRRRSNQEVVRHGARRPPGDFSSSTGCSRGPQILEELVAAGRSVVLVANVDPAVVHQKVRLLAGDPTNELVIRKSHPERAQDALVACDDDGDVLVTCVALRSLAPALDVIALARSGKIAQALRDLGVKRTLSSDELAPTRSRRVSRRRMRRPALAAARLGALPDGRASVSEAMVGTAAHRVELDPPAIILGCCAARRCSPR